ncbi:hypothetical protein [Kaistella sp.]|uniref:hypothetical protein n=1 Tax=Kaistella sp. TaxID=2782235 RepID=UPI003C494511
MKKAFVMAASCMLLLTSSCKKSTDGNKNVIKQDNGYSENLPTDSVTTLSTDAITTNAQEYTERYVGEDGTSALVTFKNMPKEKTISIRSNNKTISAPQKEVSPKGTIYGDFDITIVSKNDSITITQENNVIHLKKARGQ